MLDPEDRDLIQRWQANRDPAAARRLLKRHQKWCEWEARKAVRRYALTFDEAMQAARLGLMDAVERFELDRLTGLSGYAARWLQKRFSDLRAERVVGGRYAMEARRRIGIAVRALEAEDQPVTDAAVAKRLGWSTERVTARQRREVSIDTRLDDDDGGTLHDVLADKERFRPDAVFEAKEHHRRLRAALRAAVDTALSERNAEIMHAFMDAGCELGSMGEIATRLGVSRQQISLSIGRSMPLVRRALELNGINPRRINQLHEGWEE